MSCVLCVYVCVLSEGRHTVEFSNTSCWFHTHGLHVTQDDSDESDSGVRKRKKAQGGRRGRHKIRGKQGEKQNGGGFFQGLL